MECNYKKELEDLKIIYGISLKELNTLQERELERIILFMKQFTETYESRKKVETKLERLEAKLACEEKDPIAATTRMKTMMNDKLLYEMLYNFIDKLNVEDQVSLLDDPQPFLIDFFHTIVFKKEEVRFLMRNIVAEIHRRDRLKCQYCRIDAGLFVQSPVEPHNLCKLHRQDYETQFEDRTLTQKHPALGDLVNYTGAKIPDA